MNVVDQQCSDDGIRSLELFAGAGGGVLAGELLGFRTVCAVEIDPWAASILVARQNDGILAPFPVWDDIRTFDGRPWRGIVDLVSGGFPCQDISISGKGDGISGKKSGLWVEMARIIGEVRPRFVFVENSPVLTSRGLGRVLGDLAVLGYDARWGVIGSRHVGACHRRDRIWIYAHSQGLGWTGTICGHAKNCENQSRQKRSSPGALDSCLSIFAQFAQRMGEPAVFGMDNGVAGRMDRLRAVGNGQDPRVAKLAWEILSV